jgi:hypothetical protein
MKARLVVVFCMLLFGCDFSSYLSGPVGKAVRHEVREKRQQEIDLARVVPFEWDELFLFGPYTPRGEVCKELQLNKAECLISVKSESTDDGVMFLVLRHKDKIMSQSHS